MSALRLLAAADLHLGRRPSRLPGALADRAGRLGSAAAWRRLVEEAAAEGVHALLLAGDVVEGEKDFFEAYRELHAGVARLTEAGVRVCGVAGNHDVHVLPRLAEQLPRFRLLGRGGVWEREVLEVEGRRVTLWGWSFPAARVIDSPVAGAKLERGPGVNLGLLHCDRDQPGSAYAPALTGELQAAGLDGWLLGHVHKPDPLAPPSPLGYLGSLSAADPGEPGGRGPWLLTIAGGRIEAVEHWPLAPLRFEQLDVDLTGVGRPEDARSRLLDEVRALDGRVRAGRWTPEAVGLRVRWTGRTRHGAAVADLLGEDEREHLLSGAAGTHYFVERVEADTRPEISLDELARRDDPPGLLARRLLVLEREAGDGERRRLVAEAQRRLAERAAEARWAGLDAPPVDGEAAARWLRRAGVRLLEALLDQTEAGR